MAAAAETEQTVDSMGFTPSEVKKISNMFSYSDVSIFKLSKTIDTKFTKIIQHLQRVNTPFIYNMTYYKFQLTEEDINNEPIVDEEDITRLIPNLENLYQYVVTNKKLADQSLKQISKLSEKQLLKQKELLNPSSKAQPRGEKTSDKFILFEMEELKEQLDILKQQLKSKYIELATFVLNVVKRKPQLSQLDIFKVDFYIKDNSKLQDAIMSKLTEKIQQITKEKSKATEIVRASQAICAEIIEIVGKSNALTEKYKTVTTMMNKENEEEIESIIEDDDVDTNVEQKVTLSIIRTLAKDYHPLLAEKFMVAFITHINELIHRLYNIPSIFTCVQDFVYFLSQCQILFAEIDTPIKDYGIIDETITIPPGSGGNNADILYKNFLDNLKTPIITPIDQKLYRVFFYLPINPSENKYFVIHIDRFTYTPQKIKNEKISSVDIVQQIAMYNIRDVNNIRANNVREQCLLVKNIWNNCKSEKGVPLGTIRTGQQKEFSDYIFADLFQGHPVGMNFDTPIQNELTYETKDYTVAFSDTNIYNEVAQEHLLEVLPATVGFDGLYSYIAQTFYNLIMISKWSNGKVNHADRSSPCNKYIYLCSNINDDKNIKSRKKLLYKKLKFLNDHCINIKRSGGEVYDEDNIRKIENNLDILLSCKHVYTGIQLGLQTGKKLELYTKEKYMLLLKTRAENKQLLDLNVELKQKYKEIWDHYDRVRVELTEKTVEVGRTVEILRETIGRLVSLFKTIVIPALHSTEYLSKDISLLISEYDFYTVNQQNTIQIAVENILKLKFNEGNPFNKEMIQRCKSADLQIVFRANIAALSSNNISTHIYETILSTQLFLIQNNEEYTKMPEIQTELNMLNHLFTILPDYEKVSGGDSFTRKISDDEPNKEIDPIQISEQEATILINPTPRSSEKTSSEKSLFLEKAIAVEQQLPKYHENENVMIFVVDQSVWGKITNYNKETKQWNFTPEEGISELLDDVPQYISEDEIKNPIYGGSKHKKRKQMKGGNKVIYDRIDELFKDKDTNVNELFTIYMEHFETSNDQEFKKYMSTIYNYLIQLGIYVPFCRTEEDITINEIINNVTKLRTKRDNTFLFDTYYGHAICYRIFGVTLFKLMNELINGNLIMPRIYPYISDDMFDSHTFIIIYNIIKCLCLEFTQCILLQNYFMTLNTFIHESYSNLTEDFDTLNNKLILRIETDNTFFSTFYNIRHKNVESSVIQVNTEEVSTPPKESANTIVPTVDTPKESSNTIEPVENSTIINKSPNNTDLTIPTDTELQYIVPDNSIIIKGGRYNKHRPSSIKRSKTKRRKSIKRKIVIEVK